MVSRLSSSDIVKNLNSVTKEKREFLDGLDRTIFPSCEYKSLTGFLIEGFVGSGELPIKSYNKIFILFIIIIIYFIIRFNR